MEWQTYPIWYSLDTKAEGHITADDTPSLLQRRFGQHGHEILCGYSCTTDAETLNQ